MSTPRETLAAQFTTDHPAYKVYSYPYAPQQVGTAPVIAVWRTDLGPNPATPGQLRHSLLVQAYIGPTLGEKAEATLDDVLDAVMLSLQRVDAVVFDSAERTVFGDEQTGTFQGWTIKCHAHSDNVYKSIVLSERP